MPHLLSEGYAGKAALSTIIISREPGRKTAQPQRICRQPALIASKPIVTKHVSARHKDNHLLGISRTRMAGHGRFCWKIVVEAATVVAISSVRVSRSGNAGFFIF